MAKPDPKNFYLYAREAGAGPGGECMIFADSIEPHSEEQAVALWCALECIELLVAKRKKRLKPKLMAAAREQGAPDQKSYVLSIRDGSVRAVTRDRDYVDDDIARAACGQRGIPDTDIGKWVFKVNTMALRRVLTDAELADCVTTKTTEALEVVPPTPRPTA